MRMPAEWARHERTLMCWPARAELWNGLQAQAEAEKDRLRRADEGAEPWRKWGPWALRS